MERPVPQLDRALRLADTEQRLEQLPLAVALQSADAHHLALLEVEVDALQAVADRQPADLQGDAVGRGRLPLGIEAVEPAAEHLGDDLVVGDRCHLVSRDGHAVPEDGDASGEVSHFGEAMRDVDDKHPGCRETPGEIEQPLGLARGERRGRLVEDEDSGIAGERLGDLDHLALRKRQPADLDVRPRDRDAIAFEQRVRIGPHLAGAHGAKRVERLAAEPDVLLDREIGNERQLLKDGRDPGALGRARICGDEGLAAKQDPAFVRP